MKKGGVLLGCEFTGRETRVFISDCASVALRPPRRAAIIREFCRLSIGNEQRILADNGLVNFRFNH